MGSVDEVYHVLEFEELGRHARFMMQLLQLVGGREGIRYMAMEPHATVWSGSGIAGIQEGRHQLYLNDTALEAAQEAGLTLDVVGQVTYEDLPDNRSLILGQQGDWDK